MGILEGDWATLGHLPSMLSSFLFLVSVPRFCSSFLFLFSVPLFSSSFLFLFSARSKVSQKSAGPCNPVNPD